MIDVMNSIVLCGRGITPILHVGAVLSRVAEKGGIYYGCRFAVETFSWTL